MTIPVLTTLRSFLYSNKQNFNSLINIKSVGRVYEVADF